jgi:ATP-dependent Clp protease ATP-binding subunit ClpC
VQREIEDAISERILSGSVQNSQDILVDYISGEFTFVSSDRAESIVS